jgi:type II secretory pathway component GspD/PulD (secretin)
MVQAVRMVRCKMRNRLAQARFPGWWQAMGCLFAWFLTLGMATQGATSDANLVVVDFENIDLRVLIKFVSEVTGRVFLLDDRVRGQVSVRFANKIPINQLYDVLQSVLEVKGFATITTGPITKIVPLGSAKQQGIEVTGTGPSELGSRR